MSVCVFVFVSEEAFCEPADVGGEEEGLGCRRIGEEEAHHDVDARKAAGLAVEVGVVGGAGVGLGEGVPEA